MGALLHILQFGDSECTTYVVEIASISHCKFRYPKELPIALSTKDRYPSLDIHLMSEAKIQLYLNSKTVFRVIEDDGPVKETTSLKEFENSIIELIQGNGITGSSMDPQLETQSDT